jgi:alpha/beta hydrolase fold
VTQLSTSRIPGGFTEKTARVNGVTLNYATGGTGPAVVLLHGYPQTWYMWRKVMPALAEQYTVIAPDLRGSGGSDAPATGYDKASLAEDIHQLPRPDADVRRRRYGRRVPLRPLGRGGKPGPAAQAPAAVPRLARRAREGTSTPGGQDEHH